MMIMMIAETMVVLKTVVMMMTMMQMMAIVMVMLRVKKGLHYICLLSSLHLLTVLFIIYHIKKKKIIC